MRLAACYLEERVPSIPVPRVLAWDDGSSHSGPSYIAEQFIEGQRLSAVWSQLTEREKTDIPLEVANVIADLGETRFDFIGGLSSDDGPGPTIEAAKVFNGRDAFHSPNCYNIGPYARSKEYVLSCYDREIYYYTHADDGDVVAEAFEDLSVPDFVAQLEHERQGLAENDFLFQKIERRTSRPHT